MRLLVLLCLLPCVLSIGDPPETMEKETSLGHIRAKRSESCTGTTHMKLDYDRINNGTEEFKIGEDSYFFRTKDTIFWRITDKYYWERNGGFCNKTNTSVLDYMIDQDYIAGGCDFLNRPTNSHGPWGITPYHDDTTLKRGERFAMFGMARRVNFQINNPNVITDSTDTVYAHGKGLRLFCNRNFDDTVTMTMDIVCEVPNYNSRDVSEPGVWKERATGKVVVPYVYPKCGRIDGVVVAEYECVPPEFERDHYISDKTDCDETNGNIGCVLSIKCDTGNTAVQRFQCQFDQGWHNMDKDQKVYHPRIEQALDSC